MSDMRTAQGKVKIEWSADFAYAIGLIVTDGNLSSDGRHISFTSKDLELINHYQRGLGISVNIGRKSRGGQVEKKYYLLQFSDVIFYRFLLSIGLMPNKSKRLRAIAIPDEFFFDFLGFVTHHGNTLLRTDFQKFRKRKPGQFGRLPRRQHVLVK